MQFIVLGFDGTDDAAIDRRQQARAAHLETAKKMHEEKKWLYAAAFLDDAEKMVGSMIVCDFPSKEALQTEWLDHEPYIKGEVWKNVEIHRAQTAPFWAPK